MRSAIESTKAAISGFLLPFMFIYCPILLLKPSGSPLLDVMGFMACVICVLMLQIGFTGYYRMDCDYRERIIAIVSAALLLLFLPFQKNGALGHSFFATGVVLSGLLTLWHWGKYKIAAHKKHPVKRQV